MMLSRRDLRVLSALAEAPLGTVKVLSKLAGMTPTTFSRRLERLVKDGILISVSAEICYPVLKLEPFLFFLRSPFKHLEEVERALDLHHYTRYRVRCLGFYNGIYAIFAIPQHTLSLLLEFIDGLSEMGLINKYYYDTPVAGWVYTENNFNYYDPEADSWSFDLKDWESRIEELESPPPLRSYPPPVLHKMNCKDMRILRQLTINAREKWKVIAEKADVPQYHLSRRLRFYEEHKIIDTYRVIVHRNASRLFATLIFECQCPVSVTRRFAEAVKMLPFQSTLIPTRRGFFLQTSIPPLNFPRFGSILQKYCHDVRVLWSDYESSMRYWFWHEPYQRGGWVSTRRYMVDEVLDKLRKSETNFDVPV